MSKICHKIAEENEKLKILKTLEEINKEIQNYLNTNYKVEHVSISIQKNDKISLLYKSFEDNLEKEDKYKNELKFIQNEETYIIIDIYVNNEKVNDEINRHLLIINLALQAFAQTLYNKYLENSISNMSLVDTVTGLYNRLYLDNYADNILTISNREQKKIAFLKVGIDQFKAVIDEFDYAVGDKVLKALAESLRESIRTSDIVIKIDTDEFLVILMNIINEDNAIMISEKLINNFSNQKVVVNEETKQELMKTICSGISIYPDDASDIDEIIKKSDIALYEARNNGRSQTFKFSENETNTIDFF